MKILEEEINKVNKTNDLLFHQEAGKKEMITIDSLQNNLIIILIYMVKEKFLIII